MLEQRIQQHFIDSADLKYQSAQTLCKPVEAAIQALLACVTSGGKVLACGHGASATLAQHFATLFVGRFERERPELAALALNADGAVLTAIVRGDEAAQVFARQVRALGQAGDVLLVISIAGQEASLLRAIDAAHERDMTVLALTGQGGGPVGQALRETDVQVCVPHERMARIHEVQTLVLHCLCDGVDTQLLGEQELSP
ncbi:MAG: SIS domain-containing protein [Comamonadaceae bacterium]|jgi:D-sedoheptulose 7-phosphate isomerase|uniref:SIS domain-containing protein n=1 Tax=Candidatus Skiveiella danica TaxID=3386177 RepID=UPI0009C42422|nr:SIS domain-containing protein [Comamonadaceae bacterium]MBK9198607.1 SIS domain-containing protein [Betaproteobacteria bacterium]OQC05693.1 MAG: Phosphoheptose isomerase [Alphaproteobacteria bacterium ADurb.Bin100]HPL78337.1 SIS domain-containing protein [Burkholderiaceae bacterium]MBK6559178.1 SIS domain-containing protein [Comamonadaceae bacterium]